jgi:ACS family hexuronate transporter-like MFS transporter
MTDSARAHSTAWKWWVCALLLGASTINYMDRQTLANAAVRITRELHLDQEQYGDLETAFGWAFAAGSLVFGWLADKVPVRWLYPAVLTLWSLVGFSTGLVHSYSGLLVCRTMLGLFEAGHWPCAIKTTQRLLDQKDRTMGNSVLQSGASIGAIITPLLMNWMMTSEAGSWRFPFQAIGVGGVVWIFFWLALVRRDDLGKSAPVAANPAAAGAAALGSFWSVVFTRRFLVVLVTISLINTSWQLLRAWLPKFLIEGRGYLESDALNFNALFYVATDVGCLGAGAATLWLHRRSLSVHGARVTVFFACAVLAALAALAAFLPQGWLLLGLLLLVGAGTLGLFPCYHALTQELTPIHQGKVTGLAGVVAWAIGSPTHRFFGRLIDQTGSFNIGLAIAGLLPLVAFVFLWAFWNWPKPRPAATNGSTDGSV